MTIDAPDEVRLNREIVGEDGRPIPIEETSGSAYAELQREPRHAADTRRSPNMLLWIGAGLIAGVAARQAWSRSRARSSRRTPLRGAVAFARGESDPENFAQTRNAGPDSMRDPAAQGWDAVDEASDQSFPASDPPGFDSSGPSRVS